MTFRSGRMYPMIKPPVSAVLLALALAAAAARPAAAVPPPPDRLGADCENPAYASDQLVCATPPLLELDRGVAELAVGDAERSEQHLAWFRESRLCAFEAAHAACLAASYCARIALLDRAGSDWPAECAVDAKSYVPVRKLSRGGFARNARAVAEYDRREVALAGYVDHGNLFGDESARQVLGDRWGGPGPDADHWRFDLKARPDDPVGHSFAVVVPNDPVRDTLLAVIRADAESGRATPVFLRGTLSTFDAPINTGRRRGLRLDVRSANDIRLGPAPATGD